MKEKPQIFKTHSRSGNPSHYEKHKEKHHKFSVNNNKDKTESERGRSSSKNHNADKYRSSKESNTEKNDTDEITNDESYEELSRKKRKIERELHALDLEEAAEKRQKLEMKTYQNDKNESLSDEDLAFEQNRYKPEKKNSKHQDIRVKYEPSSNENSRWISERNRQKHERKSSKYQNINEKGKPSNNANVCLGSEKNRQKLERKTSKYHCVTVKDEPLSDDDRRLASIRNRPKQERKESRQQNINIKKEPLSDEDERLPADRNRSSRTSKNNEFGTKATPVKDKEKPDFTVSGKLAEDTNVYNGVVIKYNEPSEARKPKRRWRLYPFKGESDLPFIPIHRQSAYLLGRTRSIADIPIDHPSCSKQHAVLQFRLVPYTREDGTKGRRVRPYIIDLESANGTFVNNNRINPRCYVELMEKDVIKFGYSSREYVLLHEESKNDDYDDVRDSN